MSNRSQKHASAKAVISTFGSDVVIISSLMEVSTDNENYFLALCTYQVAFGISDYIYNY